MVTQGMHTSVVGRALENNHIELETVNIRAYSKDKHGKADDYPYGGGAGMLMQAQPVYDAWKTVAERIGVEKRQASEEDGCAAASAVRTVYVTPQGRPFSQQLARELAREEDLIFLCGHYEGIDERVLEEIVTDRVSIGDYVLTGGELPAMVMMDAIARLVPGVLHNDASAQTESFYNDLLEYPQYSRPEVWHGKKVPEVLLSGDHSKVDRWRLERAKELTAVRRPDLYRKYEEKQAAIKSLSKDKRNQIHVIESLARGRGEILYRREKQLLVCDREAKICMLCCEEDARGVEELLAEISKVPELSGGLKTQETPEGREQQEDTEAAGTPWWFVVNRECLAETLTDAGLTVWGKCSQYLYTLKAPLPVKHRDISRLTQADLAYVIGHYRLEPKKYMEERIQAGVMYGIFADGRQVGFVGTHQEGSMGMLYVEEGCRGRGYGEALLAYNINRTLERGWIPYGHVKEGNQASERLQEKLGLYKADRPVWWLEGRI